ncbi:MAG: stalk domain-containing protein, partial [Clostridia bacterium]
MKKRLFALVVTLVIVLSSLTAYAEIQVKLDGQKLNFDVPPVMINNRTMVPFRTIFEAMGADVAWYGEEMMVYAKLNGTEIFLKIGEPFIVVNYEILSLDVAPVIVDNRTLIPLRAVSEVFNMEVQWDQATQTVTINSNYNQFDFPDDKESLEKQVLNLVNKFRTEVGLTPLEWDDALADVARMHSEDMVERGFFDHYNPDGYSPFDRMEKYGISYMSAGENIAAGQTTAESVMNSWMNSPGHYANIMNTSYKKMGVGIAYGGSYGIYWTQCFT